VRSTKPIPRPRIGSAPRACSPSPAALAPGWTGSRRRGTRSCWWPSRSRNRAISAPCSAPPRPPGSPV
jgi:hypothetical protein